MSVPTAIDDDTLSTAQPLVSTTPPHPLQGFGFIDLDRSRLRNFKLDYSSLCEQQRVAELESVCGAEARPTLSEGAKGLLPESVRRSLHRPWRQRPSENVPGSPEPLQSVFAPKRSWDILRPSQSS